MHPVLVSVSLVARDRYIPSVALNRVSSRLARPPSCRNFYQTNVNANSGTRRAEDEGALKEVEVNESKVREKETNGGMAREKEDVRICFGILAKPERFGTVECRCSKRKVSTPITRTPSAFPPFLHIFMMMAVHIIPNQIPRASGDTGNEVLESRADPGCVCVVNSEDMRRLATSTSLSVPPSLSLSTLVF